MVDNGMTIFFVFGVAFSLLGIAAWMFVTFISYRDLRERIREREANGGEPPGPDGDEAYLEERRLARRRASEIARFGLKAAAMSVAAFGLLALLITAVLTAAGF